jgi:hypothetical protein
MKKKENRCYEVPLKVQTLTPTSSNIPPAQSSRREKHNPIPLAKSVSLTTTKLEVRILDGFLLLEATKMGFPEDSRQAIICDKGYTSVVEEDLLYFTGLIYIDACDNLLPLTSFQNLPRLKELRMACNNMYHITPITGFHKLQYLDLSYNHLCLDAIQELDALPFLKELDLSGNCLVGLPDAMCNFKSLERLIVENNKLSNNDVFYALSNMPVLRELCIAHNMLSLIPPDVCGNGSFRYLSIYVIQ